jgi:hypothetical protein
MRWMNCECINKTLHTELATDFDLIGYERLLTITRISRCMVIGRELFLNN